MGVTRELHLFLLDSFFIPIGLTAVQHVRAGRGAIYTLRFLHGVPNTLLSFCVTLCCN